MRYRIEKIDEDGQSIHSVKEIEKIEEIAVRTYSDLFDRKCYVLPDGRGRAEPAVAPTPAERRRVVQGWHRALRPDGTTFEIEAHQFVVIEIDRDDYTKEFAPLGRYHNTWKGAVSAMETLNKTE